MKTALCVSGTYPVSYIGRQAPQDSQRTAGQAATTAASEADQLFHVSDEARSNETCYLAADQELGRNLTLLKRADSVVAVPCLPAWTQALTAAKHRAVTSCWPMAAGPDSIRIIAALFAPANDNELASLVLMDSARLFFRDFPAHGEWRVDDEGIFHPENFQILFLARRGAAWIMALTWAGAEGDDAYLEVSDSSRTFRVVTQTYRYWAVQ